MPDCAPSQSLAVIGAGVSGCALTACLRQLGYGGDIDVWETGRGPGGRASTRRTRRNSSLRIDHGAPLLNIRNLPQPTLLAPLLASGDLVPWQGRLARLRGESKLELDGTDEFTEGELFQGAAGMDQIAAALLKLANRQGEGSIRTHFSTLVRRLVPRPGGGWRLLDREGGVLGESGFLVLSSTLLAHPRTGQLFGWNSVPLKEAAEALGDLQLDHALTSIAGIRSQASSNLMMVIDPAEASLWLQLPFRLLSFDSAAQQRWGLRRISIQPLADQRCAVVVHSSNAFAADHLDVYGSHSAIATQLGLPKSGREDEVISQLTELLSEVMSPILKVPGGLEKAEKQLMRWGAAMPLAPGLPTDLSLCRASRVGFCGDFLDGEGFGRIEGSLRSAERLAGMLIELLEHH
ncbi:MAG: NAD(P)-binding protein [Cyanobacteriota bacterium]|nr:NAD(P)-binding protein [Cyanobacteriota bacterium]